MEIIKKGEYPENNKIICEKCKCEFKYYDSEIITDMTSPEVEDFLGGFGVHKYVRCPTCNNVCTISCEFTKYEPFKWFKNFINKFKIRKEDKQNGK